MPEAISAPSTNGHHQSLEAEALAVIETVKAEPAVEASKPKRRVRRSREEVQAERAAEAVSLTINGSSYEGSPAAIAAALKRVKDEGADKLAAALDIPAQNVQKLQNRIEKHQIEFEDE